MDQKTVDVIEQCTRGSLDGTLRFPEVVSRLAAAGVRMYHVDYQRAEKTAYLRSGASHVEPVEMGPEAIGPQFSAEAVAAAVKAAQLEALPYPEFLTRTRRAGCVGYFVYLDGRRAVYHGARGEAHVELFPSQPAE